MFIGKTKNIYVMVCGHGAYNKGLHTEITRLGWLEFKKKNPNDYSLLDTPDGLKVHESYQNISGGKTKEQMIAMYKQWLLPKVELIIEDQWENNFFLVPIHHSFETVYLLIYYDRIIRD
jgi:hypothetical protein